MIKIKQKSYKGLFRTKICMVEEDPNLFFKYMPINENMLKVLKNQELYFSHSSEFNDPFDSKLDLIWRGKIEDWYRFYLKLENKNPVEVKYIIDKCIENGILKKKKGDILLHPQNKGFKTINENMQLTENLDFPRVCCFSKDKNNILMWSHYANEHNGICLCFNSEQIDNGNFLILDSSLHLLFRVVYDENLPKQVNMLSNYEPEKLVAFLHTKHSSWEYETEYRLILWGEDFHGKFTKSFRKEDLEGIIFGLKTPIEDIGKVYDIIKPNYLQEGIKVNFYKAQEIKGKYAIYVKKIDSLDKYLQKYSK